VGFIDGSCKDFVSRLSKSLYGLKQAPQAYYTWLAMFLGSMGFKTTRSDNSLFILLDKAKSRCTFFYASSAP
jgi:hypothetical protein